MLISEHIRLMLRNITFQKGKCLFTELVESENQRYA